MIESQLHVRLNKFIADSGVCGRREADRLIAAGRVMVNGLPVTQLGMRVQPGVDQVTLDAKTIDGAPRTNRYIAFHKPVGCLTSRRDIRTGPQARATVYTHLPAQYHPLDPAGRLDFDSSGLLLLSDDGDWLNQITHPKFHVPKTYVTRLNRPPESAKLFCKALLEGMLFEPEGKTARAIRADMLAPDVLQLVLGTGFKRQVRRMVAALGLRVIALKRTAIGGYALGDLPVGRVRELTPADLALITC
ncbi:MAG: pseudouridine synthase [Vampirovibrionales bacterium]|nr:pseudouridine synthase [Vampirovibrionales bacterium]